MPVSGPFNSLGKEYSVRPERGGELIFPTGYREVPARHDLFRFSVAPRQHPRAYARPCQLLV
jgi:hypothetical protein